MVVGGTIHGSTAVLKIATDVQSINRSIDRQLINQSINENSRATFVSLSPALGCTRKKSTRKRAEHERGVKQL